MSCWDLGARWSSAFRLLHCLCLGGWSWGAVPWDSPWEFWSLLWDLPRVWLLVACCCLSESQSSHWCLLLLLEGVSCWGLGVCLSSAFQLLQRLSFVEWLWDPPWEFWPLLWDLPRVCLLLLCHCLEESKSSHWCVSLLSEGTLCWGLGVCLSSPFQLLQRLCLAEWWWEPVQASWSRQENLFCRLSQPWERSLPLLHGRWPRGCSCRLHDRWDLRQD